MDKDRRDLQVERQKGKNNMASLKMPQPIDPLNLTYIGREQFCSRFELPVPQSPRAQSSLNFCLITTSLSVLKT